MILEPHARTTAAPQQRLPAEVADLVTAVVRSSRLWAAEREDVRAELENHFEEGLMDLAEQGVSEEDQVRLMMDRFGDPELAAKLIRRGKRRGRSMLWKTAMRALFVALLGMSATAGFAAWVKFAEPNPTVDYVAQINEPVEAISVQDRSWPIVQEVILQYVPMPAEMPGKPADIARLSAEDDHWALAMQWVRANRHLIPQLRDAAQRRAWGFVYDNELTLEFMRRRCEVRGEPLNVDEGVAQPSDPPYPPTLAILLPSLGDVREIAKFLVVDAKDKSRSGQFVSAWESLEIAHRLGTQLLRAHTLIDQLVGAGIHQMTQRQMRVLLYDAAGELTEDQLAVVLASELMDPACQAITPNYFGERVTFLDVLQHVFTDDGQGSGHLIPRQYDMVTQFTDDAFGEAGGVERQAYLFTLAGLHADRRATLAKYEDLWRDLMQHLNLALYDPARQRADDVVDRLRSDPVDKHRFAVIRVLLPSLLRADQHLRERVLVQRGTQTVVALMHYRFEQGTFPAALGDLVPRFLTEAPLDVYSGEPLVYRLDSDSGFVLYSVWRNFEDDHGASEVVDKSAMDMVFWPGGDLP